MKIMWFILIGLAIGIGITFLYFNLSFSKTMMLENESRYSFEETEKILLEKTAEMNWKILGNYNLKEKMAANGYEVLEAKVFDLCKPVYAAEILGNDDERIVSPLLPCRVAIYRRSNGKTYISRMNSMKFAGYMPGIVPNVMGKAAREVEEILTPLIKE